MGQALKKSGQNEPLVLSYMDRAGKIAVGQVADSFGMSKGQLAQTVGLARETLYRLERSRTAKTQGRLREMLEIIIRVTEWAGGKEQAMAWYRAQPLPAFGGRTAEALVKDGKAAAIRDYLDHMAWLALLEVCRNLLQGA
ncbi:MbcA/ParS/Xre antitoxin family protein [Mesorhizobium sp. M0203]|uniref:MbcA/ParS/Xre antitoxin family protein n=1 Tax=Mesorhizobium sp. M0203 TaxID=2956912 RepID=UPI00333ABB07